MSDEISTTDLPPPTPRELALQAKEKAKDLRIQNGERPLTTKEHGPIRHEPGGVDSTNQVRGGRQTPDGAPLDQKSFEIVRIPAESDA